MKKNIIKAINIEQQYLKARAQNNSFNFKQAISSCGFNNLKEYSEMKKQYNLQQIPFTFIESSPQNYLKDAMSIFQTKKPTVAFADIDTPCIFTGVADFNKQYCLDNGILILPHFGNGGGTIVSTPGDLAFGLCCDNANNIISHRYLLQNIKKILEQYTREKIIIDNNDILIKGKKIVGSVIYKKDNFLFFVAHFSFNNNLELIKSICPTTKIKKEPGYIDFIKKNVLKEEIKKWLKNPSY